jgi:hypothetical protein
VIGNTHSTYFDSLDNGLCTTVEHIGECEADIKINRKNSDLPYDPLKNGLSRHGKNAETPASSI